MHLFYASVAQLDRAFGSDPEGRRFESCRAHQSPRESILAVIFLSKSSISGRLSAPARRSNPPFAQTHPSSLTAGIPPPLFFLSPAAPSISPSRRSFPHWQAVLVDKPAAFLTFPQKMTDKAPMQTSHRGFVFLLRYPIRGVRASPFPLLCAISSF